MNSGVSFTHPMEERLEAYFQADRPSEEFVAALEQRLQREMEERTVVSKRQKPASTGLNARRGRVPRWAPVTLVVVTLVVTALLLVGPQRALAQVLHALGYVPGIGFVDANAARVLAEPAEMEQQGVTLRITQVLATDTGTTVLVEASGLPPREELFTPNADGIVEQPENVPARLHLPDGSILEGQAAGAGVGKTGEVVMTATLEFPPLPPMVYHAILELPYLPLIPLGKTPGNWVLPFALAPVSDGQDLQGLTVTPTVSMDTDQNGSEVPPAVVLPQPTEVNAQSLPAQQVTIEVVNAVYTAQETALQVRVDGLDPAWELQPGLMAQLSDDLGNTYDQQYPPSFGAETGNLQSVVFEPVSADATKLTLLIEKVLVAVPDQGQTLYLDMGENPQVGDTLPINQTLDVYGLPVEFSSVTLSESHAKAEGSPETVKFDFHMAPVPVQDKLSLNMLGFGRETSDVFGGNLLGYGGGMMGISEEGVQLVLDLDYDRSQPLPTGMLEIPLGGIRLAIGPLEVSWPINP